MEINREEAKALEVKTNLDHLRTMTAEEIASWLYGYWLDRGQYVWNSSYLGLIKVLNDPYDEEIWRV